MLQTASYREDLKLENFGYLEQTIETNDTNFLRKLVNQALIQLREEKNPNALSENLLLESVELCLLFAKPDCLECILEIADDIKFRLNLRARFTTDKLSLVALLSLAFQTDSEDIIDDIFLSLKVLYNVDPELLVEPAGTQFSYPFDKVSSFTFFMIQMLKFKSVIASERILSLLESLDIRTATMLATHKLDETCSTPSIIHYLAMYGKPEILAWIIERSKVEKNYKTHLEQCCSFGEEMGLIKVTPLICAITSQNVDTVRSRLILLKLKSTENVNFSFSLPFFLMKNWGYRETSIEQYMVYITYMLSVLIKEGINQEEKCKIFQKLEKKEGRNKERRIRLLNDATVKSALELTQNIRNKNVRVTIRCLLRNKKDKSANSQKTCSQNEYPSLPSPKSPQKKIIVRKNDLNQNQLES